uniref:Uncharacterized protein n=1 Tax=Anguilla anguilla TaxID=7936 RepID=A0A0E9TAP8_ANGAN
MHLYYALGRFLWV